MSARLIPAKAVLHGRVTEAVVMDVTDHNRIVFRSGISWSKRGREVCVAWIASEHSAKASA